MTIKLLFLQAVCLAVTLAPCQGAEADLDLKPLLASIDVRRSHLSEASCKYIAARFILNTSDQINVFKAAMKNAEAQPEALKLSTIQNYISNLSLSQDVVINEGNYYYKGEAWRYTANLVQDAKRLRESMETTAKKTGARVIPSIKRQDLAFDGNALMTFQDNSILVWDSKIKAMQSMTPMNLDISLADWDGLIKEVPVGKEIDLRQDSAGSLYVLICDKGKEETDYCKYYFDPISGFAPIGVEAKYQGKLRIETGYILEGKDVLPVPVTPHVIANYNINYKPNGEADVSIVEMKNWSSSVKDSDLKVDLPPDGKFSVIDKRFN